MPTSKSFLAVCCCLVAGVASAQITIEAGDIAQTIGDSFAFKSVANEATVDVGSPGGPQTWTFDTSTYVGYVVPFKIVDKATTPFGSMFPDANITIQQQLGPYAYWIYRKLSPDEQLDLGMAMANADTVVGYAYTPPGVNLALPLTLGTAWQTTFGYTDSTSDTTRTVYENHYDCEVDAWGTAVCPAGSFPCLRLDVFQLEITTDYLLGAPVYCETVLTRRYHWGTKGSGTIAQAHSMEGDTSSNFTQADDYMILVQTNTGGVMESRDLAVGLRVAVRPNPCGRFATVECALDRPGRAVVTVCDGLGRTVLTQAHSVGREASSLSLDLGGLPAGVYFCTLTAGGRATTRQLVRLQ